jgi:hypothetical protein
MTGVVSYLVCFCLFLFSCRVRRRRRSSKAKTRERQQQSRFIRGDVKKLSSLLIPLKVIWNFFKSFAFRNMVNILATLKILKRHFYILKTVTFRPDDIIIKNTLKWIDDDDDFFRRFVRENCQFYTTSIWITKWRVFFFRRGLSTFALRSTINRLWTMMGGWRVPLCQSQNNFKRINIKEVKKTKWFSRDRTQKWIDSRLNLKAFTSVTSR